MRAGAPWSLPPLCSSSLHFHDHHPDFTSAVLRPGRADPYRVHHSANFLIVAASTPFPSSFIHLHGIVSLSSSSSSSSKRSALLRYTHTPISPLPNQLSLPLTPDGLLVVISFPLSLCPLLVRAHPDRASLFLFLFRLTHRCSTLALSRPLCRSLALTRQAQATRVLLPSCATRARALVRLNSDRTSATPSAQVAAPVVIIISPTYPRILSVFSSTL